MDLDRLAKVCGQFGSDNDATRAEAARRADEMVRGAGLTWADVLLRTARRNDATAQRPAPPRGEEPGHQPPGEGARQEGRRVSGHDIPQVLIGAISILTDGPLTILVHDGQDLEWGPIAVRGLEMAEAAREGGFRMRRVSVRHAGGEMPEAIRIL